jgi:hypothetical protein
VLELVEEEDDDDETHRTEVAQPNDFLPIGTKPSSQKGHQNKRQLE